MNTKQFNISELRDKDLKQTNGGFLFLLLPALAFSVAEAALAWGPIVGATVKGWNDKT